jgi:hypothetical protein
MKKISLLFAGLFLLLLSLHVNAQEKKGADFFAGTWSVLVKGTPNGDAKMIYVLENKDGKITGVVQDSTGKEISKIDNSEVKDDEVTVYFNTQGYDINVNLKKKDEDHAAGSLMGMFDTVADRVKQTK